MIFAPRLLNHVLPALSSGVGQVRTAGVRVNSSLMDYVLSLPDDDAEEEDAKATDLSTSNSQALLLSDNTNKDLNGLESSVTGQSKNTQQGSASAPGTPARPLTPVQDGIDDEVCCKPPSLDYEGSVASLTLQFLNEHEATRVAALSWLIMLQQKAPRKVLKLLNLSTVKLLFVDIMREQDH